MFQELDMTFERGTILTAAMLQELRDYPREVLSIWYGLYPDGILAGTELAVREDGHVWLGRGLVKYDGVIYRMGSDLDLTEAVEPYVDGSDTNWKLFFSPGEEKDIDSRPSQRRKSLLLRVVKASSGIAGIEFARFKLLASTGKIGLFNEYDKKDPAKASFWNMTYCPYARRGGTTFHPYVFQLLRPVLDEAAQGEPWRYTMLEQLSTEGVLSLDLIRAVLQERGMLPEPSEGMPEAERRAALLEKLSRLTRRTAIRSERASAENPAKRSGSGKMLP